MFAEAYEEIKAARDKAEKRRIALATSVGHTPVSDDPIAALGYAVEEGKVIAYDRVLPYLKAWADAELYRLSQDEEL